jgi:hypothetical protein
MGEVYRARDTCLDRIVAIKVSEHVDAPAGNIAVGGMTVSQTGRLRPRQNNSARDITETLLTAAGVMASTMQYFARKQLEGKPADVLRDIASFTVRPGLKCTPQL